jgi:hypothetical protein
VEQRHGRRVHQPAVKWIKRSSSGKAGFPLLQRVCACYKGHPLNKSLFDHDDYAFQAPLLRTDALSSQHRCGPMNIASTESLHINTYEPLETRKNQNELPLQEDELMFLLHNEHIFTPSNLPWLHTHLQPVKACSIALMVAFPEQMCQVASTTALGISAGRIQASTGNPSFLLLVF